MIARRKRASWVTLLTSAPLLALVTLAVGCGTVTTPPSGGGHAPTAASATATPKPAPTPTATGGSAAPGQPACTGWPASVASGTLPASFVPVAVLRCVTGYEMVPGKGQWVTATLERADKDLAPLIAALRLPRGQTTPGIMCPQIAVQPQLIVLISGNGTMIVPRLPVSGCGAVLEQVTAALAKLPWQTVSVRLVSQVETQQEAASGCTPVYSDPFAMDTSAGSSPGGALYTVRPASLQVCVYSATGATGGASTAQFVRGTTVTGSTETELLDGLSGGRSTGLCTLPHPMFAVVSGGEPDFPVVYVELGGCDRVYRYASGTGMMGMSAGQATPEVVAIIESLTIRGPVPPASPQANH